LAHQKGEYQQYQQWVDRPLRVRELGGLGGARRALRNASFAAAGLRLWQESSNEAKSIPRRSISFAPDSSPNPSRTMLLTCSWVNGFAGAVPDVFALTLSCHALMAALRRHGEVNSPLHKHLPGWSLVLRVSVALPRAAP
jgi:hypothetical protein